MIKTREASFIVLSVFVIFSIFQAQKLSAQSNMPYVLKPISVGEKIYQKKKANPRLSQAALAAYGNSLINAYGLEFHTENCWIAEANNQPIGASSEKLTTFNFKVEGMSGRKIPFQILTKSWDAPCGCYFEFPLVSITDKEWTVVAGKTPIKLKRTEDIDFQEVRLLDSSQKMVLRRWFKPLDDQPAGISADGTKLYVTIAYDLDPGVLLEISENGTFRLVPKNAPNIIKTHEDIRNFNDGSGFEGLRKFKSKSRSYFVNYIYACT